VNLYLEIVRESEHDTEKYNNLVTEYADGEIIFRSYQKRTGISEYISLSRYVDAAKIYHDECWKVDGEELPYKDI
jgi:hypothetical protein